LWVLRRDHQGGGDRPPLLRSRDSILKTVSAGDRHADVRRAAEKGLLARREKP
jgi:hypothetical protein